MSIHYQYKDLPGRVSKEETISNVTESAPGTWFGVSIPGVDGRPRVPRELLLQLLTSDQGVTVNGVIPSPEERVRPESLGPQVSTIEQLRSLLPVPQVKVERSPGVRRKVREQISHFANNMGVSASAQVEILSSPEAIAGEADVDEFITGLRTPRLFSIMAFHDGEFSRTDLGPESSFGELQQFLQEPASRQILQEVGKLIGQFLEALTQYETSIEKRAESAATLTRLRKDIFDAYERLRQAV